MTQPLITSQHIDIEELEEAISPTGDGAQVSSIHGVIVAANGSTSIPLDNTVPLITEGTEIGSAPFEVEYPGSRALINFSLTVDVTSNNTRVIIAVFRNDTCIAASVVSVANAGNPVTVSMVHVDGHASTGIGSPAEPTPVVYSGRVGKATGDTGSWYVNSTSTGNNLGGALHTHFVLTEMK